MAEPRELTLVVYVLLTWMVVNQMEASVRYASFKTVNVAGTTNYVDGQQQRIIVDQQQQHQHQHQIFVDLQQHRLATVGGQQQDDCGEQQQTVPEPVAVIQDQQPIGEESEALARQQQSESQLRLRRVRHEASAVRVLYQIGSSEEELPVCEKWAVCSKVDMYQWPWVERQCRCPSGMPPCSHILSPSDGHTITDKTRQFKLCEPIKMLPKCRYFRDMAWTLRSEGNGTLQTVHCHCPKGSVAYLLKRQTYLTESKQVGYQYSFACSPQSRLLCQRKEPCRLFTVRKRQEMVDEVNTNSLCMCPQEHSCPTHHTDSGVIQSKNYSEESIRTYSGYCMPSLVD